MRPKSGSPADACVSLRSSRGPAWPVAARAERVLHVARRSSCKRSGDGIGGTGGGGACSSVTRRPVSSERSSEAERAEARNLTFSCRSNRLASRRLSTLSCWPTLFSSLPPNRGACARRSSARRRSRPPIEAVVTSDATMPMRSHTITQRRRVALSDVIVAPRPRTSTSSLSGRPRPEPTNARTVSGGREQHTVPQPWPIGIAYGHASVGPAVAGGRRRIAPRASSGRRALRDGDLRQPSSARRGRRRRRVSLLCVFRLSPLLCVFHLLRFVCFTFQDLW